MGHGVIMNTKHIPHTDHKSTFEHLSKEYHVSFDEVGQLYKNELDKAGAGARITIYISIFAFRKVREKLRLRNTEKPDPQE